jgi:gas vesicle protein
MRKLLAFVLGFLVGAVVGVAIATLLAPESGEQTRGQIQLRVQNVIDEGKRAAADRRVELESQLDQLKQGKSLEEVQ